jgi:SAM-dependent methyltransferase
VDAVLSLDVFEHIQDDSKAISECRRVLKKGGHLIFTVPAWSRLYSGFDRQVSHVRRYDRAGLEAKLAGLEKIYLSYWNFILFPLFAAGRLIRRRLPGRGGKGSDVRDAARLPWLFNESLYLAMRLDNALIRKGARLPWGLSLCGIYQKR